MLAHLKFRRAQKGKVVKFSLPFSPYSDYLVLLFLIGVGIVLVLKTETLIALIGSNIWLIALWAFHSLKSRKKDTI